MPTAVTDLPVSVDSPRKRWTRSECDNLPSALLDLNRFELIDGDLIERTGKKRPHVVALSLLYGWLIQIFGNHFVSPGTPIDVAPRDNPTNEPVPGLVVTAQEAEYYSSNPLPADLRLVVEVSDTTIGFDLRTKAGLYARAGIVEYWVLDIAGRRMVVHRDPGAGRYRSVIAFNEDEPLSPLAAPEAAVLVRDLLPKW